MGGWAFSIHSLNAGVILHALLLSAFFSNLTFSNNYFRNTIRVPNSLDPDQDSHLSGLTWVNFVLFDLILYVPSTIFQLNRDGSVWVEPVLS